MLSTLFGGKITRTAPVLVIVALLLPLAGCGNSEKQNGSASGKHGVANEMPDMCSSILGAGLAKQCAVNSHDNLVEITIDSLDDEVARNACADIADKMAHLTANLSGRWKLQVFSPYRSDKPMAACYLH